MPLDAVSIDRHADWIDTNSKGPATTIKPLAEPVVFRVASPWGGGRRVGGECCWRLLKEPKRTYMQGSHLICFLCSGGTMASEQESGLAHINKHPLLGQASKIVTSSLSNIFQLRVQGWGQSSCWKFVTTLMSCFLGSSGRLAKAAGWKSHYVVPNTQR